MPMRSEYAYFVLDTSLYLVSGRDSSTNVLADVWEYRIKANMWHQKNRFLDTITGGGELQLMLQATLLEV